MSAKREPKAAPRNLPPKKQERFTEEEVAEALRTSRGFVSAAARKLACDPSTIRDYMERYPALRIVRHEAREEEKDVAELKLGQAIRNGEAWAICFYLKTQAKDRGYVERSEVVAVDLNDLAPEQQARVEAGEPLAEVLSARQAGGAASSADVN